VRAIDVAPTVAKLLGIDAPKHSEGSAIPQLVPPLGEARD
jgi:arylsulfatase A-like enzyme